MRLPALAVQLQGFTHSANKANVGVSLRKACVGKNALRQSHSDLQAWCKNCLINYTLKAQVGIQF